MKTGKTLMELAAEVERQSDTRHDFIAPSQSITMEATGKELTLKDAGTFDVNSVAHGQLSDRLKIPKRYYDRMLDSAPELLAGNVNHWLQGSDDKRMVRTLDGTARAVLSDRYRPLDNFELMQAVLPVLKDTGVEMVSCELTERRLYMKAVTPKVTAEVEIGDVVQAGILVSNSEVGCGSVRIEPLIFRLICLNLAVMQDRSVRKYHVGRISGNGGDVEQFFRDETREADDTAFWMKVRDVIGASFKEEVFRASVDRLKNANERDITGSVEGAIEMVAKEFSLTEGEREGVLRNLIIESNLTQYGLLNAVTRTSAEVEDYDRATDLERVGGKILELPMPTWYKIATA